MIETVLSSPKLMIFLVYIPLSLVLGMLIGLERSLSGKSAGMRTYGLVSMGSCLLVVVSTALVANAHGFNFDPTRLAAAIITGIGFLGAGLIISDSTKITGLTTAAGLWVSCAIGIVVGFGYFLIATYAALLALLVLSIFGRIEYKLLNRNRLS